MKLIEPSHKIIQQAPGLEGMFKHIELAGRTCYKSEDKITEDSAKEFVNRMIKSGHGATLEHGTVYMLIPFETHSGKYSRNKYSKVCDIAKLEMGDRSAVTTNLRVLVENGWLDDLQYICEPTKYHEKRVSVKFICSRAISHELVRHRVFSFCQESQRYCAYNKDKFGNEITFISPLYIDSDKPLINNGVYDRVYEVLTESLSEAEKYYFTLLNEGFRAEEAREVLPNSTKTEIIMTGFMSDWKHFFKLRCDKSAHPEMRRLVNPLNAELQNE